MRKLARTAVNTWLSYSLASLWAVTSIVFIFGALESVHAVLSRKSQPNQIAEPKRERSELNGSSMVEITVRDRSVCRL